MIGIGLLGVLVALRNKLLDIYMTLVTPYTLHPTPYTLHPTPYTLHHTPYIYMTLVTPTLTAKLLLLYYSPA